MTYVFRFAARSHVGPVRENNEDSGCANEHLLVVADGVGGNAYGEVASATTIDTIRELDQAEPFTSVADLKSAVDVSNKRLSARIKADPELDGMATTLTALLLQADGELGMLHVGDSRAYFLRDGELRQLSRDHTLIQEMIDQGQLDRDEAKQHPLRNVITRQLHGQRGLNADLGTIEIEPGDRLLACSDGLTDAVSEDVIHRALREAPDVEKAAEELIRLALEAQGHDNITCVVGEVAEQGGGGGSEPENVDPPAAETVAVGAVTEVDLAPIPEAAPPAAAPDAGSGTDPNAEGDGLEAEADEDEELRYAVRPPPRFRWLVRTVVALACLGLLGAGGFTAYSWAQDQYYVGADGDRVAIFRGLPQLSSVVYVEPLKVRALPERGRTQVRKTIPADDMADARKIVIRLRRSITQP